MHAAARVGDVARLQRCDVFEIEQQWNDMTPLMRAVYYGRRAAVRHLVERGANASFQTLSGRCALLYAVERNDVEIAKYLIDVGGSRCAGLGSEKVLRNVCCKHYATMAVLLAENGARVDRTVAIAAACELPEGAARKVLACCPSVHLRATAARHPLLAELGNAAGVRKAKWRAEEAKRRAEEVKRHAEVAETLDRLQRFFRNATPSPPTH